MKRVCVNYNESMHAWKTQEVMWLLSTDSSSILMLCLVSCDTDSGSVWSTEQMELFMKGQEQSIIEENEPVENPDPVVVDVSLNGKSTSCLLFLSGFYLSANLYSSKGRTVTVWRYCDDGVELLLVQHLK